MIDNRKIKTSTKIVIPIFIIAIFMSFFISFYMDGLLKKHIENFYLKSLDIVVQKNYYIVKSEYKNLFYNYGDKKDEFLEVQEVVKNETIQNLKISLENSDYNSFIIIDDEVVPLKGGIKEAYKIKKIYEQKEESLDYFISSVNFIPWKWKIIVYQSKGAFFDILNQNKYRVASFVLLMAVLIMLVIVFMIKIFMQKQITQILKNLKEISKGKYEKIKILNFYSSYELFQLISNINRTVLTLHRKKEQLETAKDYTRAILESQKNIIIVSDGERIYDANNEFFKYFDDYKNIEEFNIQNSCVCGYFESINGEEYDGHKADCIKIISQNKKQNNKVVVAYKRKRNIFNVSIKMMHNTNKYVISMNDITNMENYKNELHFNLYHNDLTRLPNRRKLSEDIEKVEGLKALIVCDLDSLKEINDFYGHSTGDMIIRIVSQRLNNFLNDCESLEDSQSLQILKKHSKLYHLGGDEFAIAIFNMDAYEESELKGLAEASLQKIQDQVLKVKNHSLFVRASMGVSIGSKNLFTQADMALKEAKAKKKDIVLYDKNSGLLEEYKENLVWIQRLEEALSEDRLVCVYQPIYCNKSKQIKKYETLVRLKDEEGSLIAPYFFLEVARKAKLYSYITKTVIKKSFEHFKDKKYSFSINISIEDIEEVTTRSYILEMLSQFPEPHRVVFELLESEQIEKYSEINEFLFKLKEYGAKVAVDDFGTGYSNFSYLLNLDIDILKIDGSLIKNLDTDANSRAVVHTIVDFCKHSNIEIVAEYVDRQEVFDKVNKMGIDYTQGYFISEPKEETL